MYEGQRGTTLAVLCHRTVPWPDRAASRRIGTLCRVDLAAEAADAPSSGAGQSGTRSISHTLSAIGVWMGEPLNVSGNLLPPDAMYEASRLIANTFAGWEGWSGISDVSIRCVFRPSLKR